MIRAALAVAALAAPAAAEPLAPGDLLGGWDCAGRGLSWRMEVTRPFSQILEIREILGEETVSIALWDTGRRRELAGLVRVLPEGMRLDLEVVARPAGGVDLAGTLRDPFDAVTTARETHRLEAPGRLSVAMEIDREDGEAHRRAWVCTRAE